MPGAGAGAEVVGGKQILMWTDERVEQAKAWVSEGMTAREIAERFGTTRNAVIGKLRRAGHRGGGGIAPKEKSERRPKVAKPPRPKNRHYKLGFGSRFQSPVPLKAKPVIEPPVPPEAMMLGIMDLGPTACKFPIGDPRHADFGYCGHKRIGVSPYCPYHHALAYRSERERAR